MDHELANRGCRGPPPGIPSAGFAARAGDRSSRLKTASSLRLKATTRISSRGNRGHIGNPGTEDILYGRIDNAVAGR